MRVKADYKYTFIYFFQVGKNQCVVCTGQVQPKLSIQASVLVEEHSPGEIAPLSTNLRQ